MTRLYRFSRTATKKPSVPWTCGQRRRWGPPSGARRSRPYRDRGTRTSPASNSEWSANAFEKYLGLDRAEWRKYDTCRLIEDGHRFTEFLVDQGAADGFLEHGLRPWALEEACAMAAIPLTLRMQPGYDHSYYFISSFMAEHIDWYAERLFS